MARLTNRQTEIVVNEIHERVSLPIIEENKKLLASVKPQRTQYHRDVEEFEKLDKEISELREKRNKIESRYIRKEYKGFNFMWDPMKEVEKFDIFQAKKQVELKEVPSKDEIEKQVILAGNKEIPTLIEELILKLNK